MHRLIALVPISALVLDACFHRTQATLRIGDQVNRPPGLDSVATGRWVDAQRVACPGRVRLVFDEGVVAADMSRVARYRPFLAVAQCVAP
jgi:hypothetical protein